MNGLELFMEMSKKKSQKIYLNHYKRVITSIFLDANLLHDIVTGKSVTAVLHFVNTTPTDWFPKRQATVETATYGSELVAAKLQQNQLWTLEIH